MKTPAITARKVLPVLPLFALLLAAQPAQASCAIKQTACETTCKVRYMNDTFGKVGCLTQCKAERVSCSASETASEAGKKTKSLLKD